MTYSRKRYPVYHMIKGIIVILCSIYLICKVTFFGIGNDDSTKYIDIIIIGFTVTNLFDVFRRKTLNISFNDEKRYLQIQFLTYFFALKQVKIDYDDLCYMAYNSFKYINKFDLNRGFTNIRFYNKKKYIAQVDLSSDWDEEMLNTLNSKISKIGVKYQLSPGML